MALELAMCLLNTRYGWNKVSDFLCVYIMRAVGLVRERAACTLFASVQFGSPLNRWLKDFCLSVYF